jgi:hypothetical protein
MRRPNQVDERLRSANRSRQSRRDERIADHGTNA